MTQPSRSRRYLALGTLLASSLALAALAPPSAGASARKGHGGDARHEEIRAVESKTFGKILVDSAGQTLYTLVQGKSSPACSGACAGVWPPLLSQGKPRAAKGVERGLLGTVKRGKALQVTFDGWRLYTYVGDLRPRQTLGEGIKSFGGTWLVVGMHGAPVTASVALKSKNKTKSKTKSSTSGGSSSSGGGGW
jgi:predicted lipoprotein with Yx(FWY)xxD motif